MHGEAVSVEQGGRWLPGTVLWEFPDNGRTRALVRLATSAGIVVRRLHWSDELRPSGRVLELPLVVAEYPLDQPA